MRIGMKYIVIKTLGYSEEEIILFSSALMHADFSKLCRDAHIVSAGFITVKPDGKATCFGESTSLALTSRGQIDAFLFSRANWAATLWMESESPMTDRRTAGEA